VLVECGYTQATTGDGQEYNFCPSLGRIASMGSPRELVELFAAVHGPDAAKHAPYVLACLCEQEDATPLIGGEVLDIDQTQTPPKIKSVKAIKAAMPAAEMVVLAQHLLRHGMVGMATPGGQSKPQQGKYAATFDAAEYIAAARVHLGLSSADAEALSMTEFQRMFDMKYPQAKKTSADIPTREEYLAAIEHFKQRGQTQGAARG